MLPCFRCGFEQSLDRTPKNCVRCLRAALTALRNALDRGVDRNRPCRLANDALTADR